jgi:hypothetical protein
MLGRDVGPASLFWEVTLSAKWITSLLIALACVPSILRADYAALETENARVIYLDVVHTTLAPHTAQCTENALRIYERIYGYTPSEKITVLLDDSHDFNNAMAFASPRNTLVVQIAPANMVYETLPSNERIYHTLNHEVMHIVGLDQAVGSDRFFRKIFLGKVAATPEQPETVLYEYLTHPRFAAPRWYHEGIAVFLETWLAGGLGRARGSYDEMVFRSMVLDDSHFYDPLGLESEGTKTDFQVGANSYLYGTRFMTWLAYTQSPEKLTEWTARANGSKKYYSSQFKRVFGQSLDDAWQEFQRANLDSIQCYPLTAYRDLSDRPLGSVSRAFIDKSNGSMYAGLRYPGVLGHVAAISLDDGNVDKICNVKGPALYYVTSLAYDPAEGNLFYTADNNFWRDLHVIDLEKGEAKRLIKDGRIGDLIFNGVDRSLYGVRHFNGLSTLVRLPPPYESWNQVYTWPYGRDIYDIDISPDGKLLSFSRSEISGRQSLHLVEMEALRRGEAPSREVADFSPISLPANFVFSPEGRYLYGSSYYTGVSNIWRYDLHTDALEMVTNTDTGFFRPLPLGGDSLIVFRYTGEGFVPALVEARPFEDAGTITFLGQKVAEKHPVVWEWNAGNPGRVALDSVTTYKGDYRNVRNIGLESMYPVVQGYKDYGAVGVRANFSDPGFWNNLNFTATYTPATELNSDERLHARLEISRGGWQVTGLYNPADFYDLFGPTKRSRKGYAAGLEYKRNLIYDRPKTMDLDVATTFWGNLERVPYAQNIPVVFGELWTTQAKVTYKDLRRSLGSVDYEKGVRAEVALVNNYFNNESVPITYGNLDFGIPLLRHSSIWLRNSTGISMGERDEPFANFYFGGFGNNWVDHLPEQRYRDFYAFPGVELNSIFGTNYVKSMLEWNLPPLRFERLGIPSFYVTWARTAIFTTGIVTNVDLSSVRQKAANVGGQIDFRFSFLSRLKMTFSVGYAVGFRDDARRSDEWMFSLKVL